MKLTALVALFAAITVSSVSAAETTVTTTTTNSSSSSLASFYNTVKESPFSMAYLNDTYSQYNIDGFTSYHYLYAHYKLNANNRLSVIPAFKTDFKKNFEGTSERVNHTSYHSTQLRYSLSNILTTEDHGVNLSAQARYYVYSKDNAEATGSDGYGRIILSASRSLGKNTLSLSTDSVVYNKNSSSAANTHYNKIGVGYGYQFNDIFSASTSMNWYKFDSNNSDAFTEYSYYSVGLDFATPIGLSISPYIEGVVTQAKDGRDGLASDIVRNSSVGVSFYYSWF
ncbi:hypothetical protein [Halobacteriovorax sp. HLS]|uniref:hypothetical protein n=1 Tax=Halobacteriovorax sp. HLS TaxID=2234000 RepID=UPI000FDADB25|nr:hypothetical protein [Halobacteriovorax sp. HLS]